MYRKALEAGKRKWNMNYINTADNKCKAVWSVIKFETNNQGKTKGY